MSVCQGKIHDFGKSHQTTRMETTTKLIFV